MAAQGQTCYMTLVMSDSYLPGAMVLGHSIKDSGTSHDLVALVTLDTLSVEVIDELKTLYHIIPVDRIPNPKPANLYLMGRADLLYAFTKIALWRQTQYKKIVYLDADIVVLRNIDELFNLDVPFAAAPDIGWPDAFNSGMMVLTPDMGDFWAMRILAQSGDSFDGADQGLLNQYYEHKPWHRLSFTYNCTPNAEYQWEPAYRYYKANIKAVHFIGKDKPWFIGRQAHAGSSGTYGELSGRWWSVYDRHYRQAPSYVPGKSYTRSTAVQERVCGESIDMYYGVPESERLPPPSSTDVAPTLVSQQSSRQQVTIQEPPPEPQNIPSVTIQQPSPDAHHHNVQSTPQAHEDQHASPQQEPPPFQAPQMEWDATRSAPPSESRPEAQYFPSQHYTFEENRKKFQAPSEYPQPPKDMWYQPPESKPAPKEPPKAIFPWETATRKNAPTRVFADDYPPTPEQEIASPTSSSWADSSGGMEQYIRNIMKSQHQSGPSQSPRSSITELTSPTGRRESLLFTGLPAVQDRPSLPVTPAPVIARSYFPEIEDGKLELPEVLPDQAEWNPEVKLEELRRSSLVEISHLVQPLPLQSAPAGKNKSPLKQTSNADSESEKSISSSTDPSVSALDFGTERDESSVVSKLETAAALESAKTKPHKSSAISFNTPKFEGKENEDVDHMTRSPGSFSAETALLDSTISPTER